MPDKGGCPATGPVASPAVFTMAISPQEEERQRSPPATVTTMRPTDIAGIVSASSPAVSPDGSLVAFVVSRVDEPANRYRSQIWLAPASGDAAAEPLTSGDQRDGSPVWSPSGRALAFTSHRSEKDEETTIHVMPVGGPGETRTIAALRGGVDGLAWSPDGQLLAFASRTFDGRYDESDPAKQPARQITRFFSRWNGENWVYDRPHHIYVVPADGTEAPRNLTPGEYSFVGPAWLPDSSGVVCAGAAHDTWDRDLAQDLQLVSLDSERRALTQQTGIYSEPAVSPDGRRVAFLGHDDPLTDPQNGHVGILDLESGQHRWMSTALDRTWAPEPGIRPPIWNGEHLIALCEDRGNAHLYRVAGDGSAAPSELVVGERMVTAFDLAGGTLAFTASTVDRPAELFVVPENGSERRITMVTERFAARVGVRPAERFVAPSTDGVEVDGWVLTPPGFDPATRYPVLLNVHGGPFAQYGNRFFDEVQIQAAAGYLVVMGNPRGPPAGTRPGVRPSWAPSIRRRQGGAGAPWTSRTSWPCSTRPFGAGRPPIPTGWGCWAGATAASWPPGWPGPPPASRRSAVSVRSTTW